MSDDEDRDAILRRRQRLMALALAGLTSAAGACGGDEREPPPQACLTPMADPGQEVEPQVCLSMAMPEEDAGALEVTPVPCLTPPRQPDDVEGEDG